MTTPEVPISDKVFSRPGSPALTGDLRSTLQPVTFVRLTSPVKTIDDTVMFAAGDLVSAQYWGGGHVTLTRVSDEARAIVVAHDIKAVKP